MSVNIVSTTIITINNYRHFLLCTHYSYLGIISKWPRLATESYNCEQGSSPKAKLTANAMGSIYCDFLIPIFTLRQPWGVFRTVWIMGKFNNKVQYKYVCSACLPLIGCDGVVHWSRIDSYERRHKPKLKNAGSMVIIIYGKLVKPNKNYKVTDKPQI